MQKGIKVLEKAIKDLDIEISIWNKQEDFGIVKKCMIERDQITQALNKLKDISEDRINSISDLDKFLLKIQAWLMVETPLDVVKIIELREYFLKSKE